MQYSGDTSFRAEGLGKSKFPGAWRQNVVSRELPEGRWDLHRDGPVLGDRWVTGRWRHCWESPLRSQDGILGAGREGCSEDLGVNWTYPPGSVGVVSLFFLFLRVQTRRHLSHGRIKTQRAITSLWKTALYVSSVVYDTSQIQLCSWKQTC